MEPNLTLVVHGESGVGKTWLGATAPGPRLIIDAEGGSGWTPGKKVAWDVDKGTPPPDTEETCVSTVKNFKTLGLILQWLQSGQHPFRSVVLDSLTEIQKRCLDNITGVEQADQRAWGEVLRKMEGLVRTFRDLTIPNGVPTLDTVVFVAGSQVKDGVTRPHLQGQLGNTLPYFVDAVGYLYLKQDEDGEIARQLLVAPVGGYVAKDRTGKFGTVIPNPNVADMLGLLRKDYNA
jgi:hypothetical protein